jgi:hypothetical protein
MNTYFNLISFGSFFFLGSSLMGSVSASELLFSIQSSNFLYSYYYLLPSFEVESMLRLAQDINIFMRKVMTIIA